MNIQKLIRYEFFQEKNDYIDFQSNIELLTIMRGIFLKYSKYLQWNVQIVIKKCLFLFNHIVIGVKQRFV